MKFITVAQFRVIDEKVKNEIYEWWKPAIGDLVVYTCFPTQCMGILTNILEVEDALKVGIIPLLTEGQLIEFIRYKAKDSMQITLDRRSPAMVDLYHAKTRHIHKDLLSTLWEVAQEVCV